MERFVYAVAMVPTAFNGAEMRHRLEVDMETLQRTFDSPLEAVAYAMDSEWWPFLVERIPFQQV